MNWKMTTFFAVVLAFAMAVPPSLASDVAVPRTDDLEKYYEYCYDEDAKFSRVYWIQDQAGDPTTNYMVTILASTPLGNQFVDVRIAWSNQIPESKSGVNILITGGDGATAEYAFDDVLTTGCGVHFGSAMTPFSVKVKFAGVTTTTTKDAQETYAISLWTEVGAKFGIAATEGPSVSASLAFGASGTKTWGQGYTTTYTGTQKDFVGGAYLGGPPLSPGNGRLIVKTSGVAE